MTRTRRAIVLAVAAALTVTALAIPASASGSHDRTYRVTITNLTNGQWMTPFVVATHTRRFRMFQVWRTASDGLQQLAENGGVPVLANQVSTSRGVSDVQVAGAAPVLPG